MYLEKLEIQGFKSFAHKNKLIFSGLINGQQRGLTAIVGPNGSGKSNVADAIRWVLGEQSLKTLRGKKSEDVIFSGSDQKGQLGMAEVSLYLNNLEALKNKSASPETIESEKDLDQLILGCPEIIITRRIYRNGDSEYLLNNSRVRLADIQMLLAKANFGQRTYSVIGQGMVENFLNASAAERKDFFDEATGVKHFQIKRDAALNKLESSYGNLQQVEMLLAEIRPRLKGLTRQVEKLKRRSEIENELRTNELNYYSYFWQNISEKLNTANNKFLQLEKTKLEKEKRLDKLKEELNKIRITDNYQEMNDLQPRLKELENQKNQQLKQIAKLQAELELEFEAQGKFDVSWLNSKQVELNNDLRDLEAEITGLQKNSSAKKENDWTEKLRLINQEIAQAGEWEKQISRLEDSRSQYLKQIAKLEAILEANLEVQGQFDLSWLNNKQVELEGELKNLDKDLVGLDADNSQEEKQRLENKLKDAQERLSLLNKELAAINQRLAKTSLHDHNNDDLRKLINDFLKNLEKIGQENDVEKIKKLINAAKSDFQEKITSLIEANNGDELNKIKILQEEIIALAETKQETNNLLNAELLRLSSVNERHRLLNDKREQLVREINDLKIKLEKVPTKFDAAQIEADKRKLQPEIAKLEQEITKLNKNFSLPDLQNKKATIEHELQEYRLKESTHNERLRLLEAKYEKTKIEITDIVNKLAKSREKFNASDIEKEKITISERLEKIEQEIKALEKKLELLNQAKEKEKGVMFACQESIQALQQEINEVMSELNNLQIEATRQETKLEDLENNIRNDGLDIGDIKNHQVLEESVDTDRWLKNLNNQKSQLEQIGGIDPETEKEYEETKERYDFLSAQTEDLNKAVKSLEEIIYELDLNIKERFDQEFKTISEKFNDYFKILFNGGQAKIAKLLVEENDKADKEEIKNNNGLAGLTASEAEIKNETEEKLKRIKFLKKHNAVDLAGIEIQATPPGKKIQLVTMLSGGERALTAIALISAIISANPSPFVVLDEVDAALDESNSERLAKILEELSNKTQFIIITHNRASMRRASILYGVTMESDGVSKLLSVKLDELKK